MDHEPGLRLIPDWPRIRQLVAKRLGKTESEVQAMADSDDSLEQVELVMAVEEVLEVQERK
jgi:acyl carrier protein